MHSVIMPVPDFLWGEYPWVSIIYTAK